MGFGRVFRPYATHRITWYPGHIEFTSDLEPILHDFRTPQFEATLTAGETSDLSYELTIHQGINKKQENVTLSERN